MRTLVLAAGLLLSATTALALPTAAAAAEKESASALALELARLSLPKATWDEMIRAIEASQLDMLEQMPGEKDPALLAKAKTLFQTTMSRLLDYEEMVDLQAGLLAKYYTAAELKELIRFYGSPLGQKSLRITPEVMKDVMAAVQQRLMTELPKLQQQLVEDLGADARQ